LLVGEDFAVGEAAVGVDGGVDEGVADVGASSSTGVGTSGPTVDAPAATSRDPAKLL
jgi:hypothetical protein